MRTTLFVLFTLSAAAQAPAPATIISAAEVQSFIRALPKNAVNDRPIRVVDVGGYRVGVYGVFRPKAAPLGDPILHETKVTEIYQVLEGAGTLVYGGKLADTKREKSAIGVTNVRGSRIEGGSTRRVAKGDMVIIPANTPHWFSSLEGDFTYVIIRPDPANELPLK